MSVTTTTDGSGVKMSTIKNVMVAGARDLYDQYNTRQFLIEDDDGEMVMETKELSDRQKQAIVSRAMYAAGIDRANVDTLIHGANDSSPDEWGKTWASMRSDVEEEAHPAEWDNIDHPDAVVKEGRYGKYDASAGFRRNSDMVERADALVAFWDGESSGTKDSIDKAREAGIPVQIIRLDRKSERSIIFKGFEEFTE